MDTWYYLAEVEFLKLNQQQQQKKKISSNTSLYTRSKGIQGISQIDEISRNGIQKSDRELFELFDRDCILF